MRITRVDLQILEKNDKALSNPEEDDLDSKFFVVRVSGGQESLIASMLYTRLTTKKIEGIYSILFLEHFKGYVIVEALDSNIAYEAFMVYVIYEVKLEVNCLLKILKDI